jgi:hypothetical protein
MASPFSEGEFALHKYYLWASRMKDHAQTCGAQPEAGFEQKVWRQRMISYAALWLSLLFVVCEGWTELELKDPSVDALLGSPHRDLLRRFRNGAFHFQSNYFDDRFTDFFVSDEPTQWAKELHAAFGAWFVRRAATLGVKLGDA